LNGLEGYQKPLCCHYITGQSVIQHLLIYIISIYVLKSFNIFIYYVNSMISQKSLDRKNIKYIIYMEEKKIIKETIKDGVKITEHSDGTTIFTLVKEPVKKEKKEKNVLKKAIDWYKDLKIKPFVKVVDLNKPEKEKWWDETSSNVTDNQCYKEKPSVVVGISMDF